MLSSVSIAVMTWQRGPPQRLCNTLSRTEGTSHHGGTRRGRERWASDERVVAQLSRPPRSGCTPHLHEKGNVLGVATNQGELPISAAGLVSPPADCMQP